MEQCQLLDWASTVTPGQNEHLSAVIDTPGVRPEQAPRGHRLDNRTRTSRSRTPAHTLFGLLDCVAAESL